MKLNPTFCSKELVKIVLLWISIQFHSLLSRLPQITKALKDNIISQVKIIEAIYLVSNPNEKSTSSSSSTKLGIHLQESGLRLIFFIPFIDSSKILLLVN